MTKSRGLTLSEVVIAIGLLSFLILGMIGVFIGGLQLMERSEQRTRASNVGSSVLEAISDEGGFHFVPDSDMTFDGSTTPAPGEFPPPPYPESQEFEITVETRVIEDETRAVQVRVAWKEGSIKLEKVYNEVE